MKVAAGFSLGATNYEGCNFLFVTFGEVECQ